MSKPIIIIDPGHGGKDVGGGTNKYFFEKDLNLKISLYQYKRFKELNIPVAITRIDDRYLDWKERTQIVKNSEAKYCISNHINAASPSVRGAETIHSIYSNGKLAKSILDSIENEGMPKRRFFSKESSTNKGKDYYFMHRETGAVETIIVEYGFATNKEDTKLLLENWEKYAEEVIKAFCLYTNNKYYAPDDSPNKDGEGLPIIKKKVDVKIGETVLSGYITDEGRTVIELIKLAKTFNYNLSWDKSTNSVIIKKNK